MLLAWKSTNMFYIFFRYYLVCTLSARYACSVTSLLLRCPLAARSAVNSLSCQRKVLLHYNRTFSSPISWTCWSHLIFAPVARIRTRRCQNARFARSSYVRAAWRRIRIVSRGIIAWCGWVSWCCRNVETRRGHPWCVPAMRANHWASTAATARLLSVRSVLL